MLKSTNLLIYKVYYNIYSVSILSQLSIANIHERKIYLVEKNELKLTTTPLPHPIE